MARIVFLLALFTLAMGLEVDRVTLKDGRVIDGTYNQLEGYIDAQIAGGQVRVRIASGDVVTLQRVTLTDLAPEKKPAPPLPSAPPPSSLMDSAPIAVTQWQVLFDDLREKPVFVRAKARLVIYHYGYHLALFKAEDNTDAELTKLVGQHIPGSILNVDELIGTGKVGFAALPRNAGNTGLSDKALAVMRKLSDGRAHDMVLSLNRPAPRAEPTIIDAEDAAPGK